MIVLTRLYSRVPVALPMKKQKKFIDSMLLQPKAKQHACMLAR
jgi:hypothetical protein